jgi:uncharacterized membrane protein
MRRLFPTRLRSFWDIAAMLLLGWFTVLMVRITAQYIPWSRTAAFLQIKQTEVEGYDWYLPVFYTHVYSTLFTLPAGFTQFRKRLLQTVPRLHRQLGYVYVVAVLLFAAPSGLLMGLVANGGIIAQTFFTVLAIFWWISTYKALQTARQRRFEAHRAWMTRSYALALSAITLRLWKLVLVQLFAPPPMEVYVLVSGLGWIPNWLLAEWMLFRNAKRRQARLC